jgi:uncharacterized OB-fold protein
VKLLRVPEESKLDQDLRPPPQPDAITSFFWNAASQGRLVLQRCSACGYLQHPPEIVCTECQHPELEHVEVAGRGHLYSFAVAERAFHPGFVAHLPYVVALVELVEQPGLRLFTNIVEADPERLRVGMPVEVAFEKRGDMTLPQFRPIRTDG